ncbi:GSCFA domain-containing protein [Marinoscillum furvescens]|uniref:GSCFA family protein n=1 Tax=Marinoscillum furvescens DSM 4134 TaxID=1122208 RepID=A0A3D9L1U4_MARFU|nr:GSCFA domain-containing protein [Marinoscillum furvescens]RED96193.1 GSCFA family protein [Marinoscillum furvescens DSM 4134]
MFTLPFTPEPSTLKIRLKDTLFSIGSCFSDNIGQQLKDHKFNILTNPLGVIYNPYSIFKNLRLILSEGIDPENFIQNDGVYFHWDTHSAISGTDLGTFKNLLAQRSLHARQSLTNANWMILTFGSIYVYKYLKTGKIVANCHKVPSQQFEKMELSIPEIIEDYRQTMELIRSINGDVKVILTVSPVRHIREGLVANNYSKSALLQAVHKITNQDPNAYYFPSYEIMIDELRDYRFYKEDMIHPSEQAITYIWEQFVKTYMDTDSQKFIQEWARIKKSLEHRAFHPQATNHQKFLKSTIQKLEKLGTRVDVSSELELIKKQLL